MKIPFQKKKHTHITVTALLSAIMVTSTAIANEDKVVNIYNWSDYIAEDTIEKFEAKTGIKVVYDVFDSNEILQTKMLTGATGYDVVVPSGDFLEKQIKAGVFQPLERAQLTNWGNLDEKVLKAASHHDPENKHSVNYMWGTNGFGYNVEKINERMVDAPIDSWAMIFDKDVVSKFANCGVTLLDSPTEIYPLALAYLGLPQDQENPEYIEKVEQLLLSIRPYVKYFHSSQYINDLANGDVCLSAGFSGDVLQARDRADEAENGVQIAYVTPKEGSLIWFDMMAIPADAPHPENAHAFINFIMEPEIIAEITNYVYYANGNKASLPFIEDEIKNDPSIYPSDAVRDTLFTAVVYSPQFARTMTRSWTTIKTGN